MTDTTRRDALAMHALHLACTFNASAGCGDPHSVCRTADIFLFWLENGPENEKPEAN